MKLLAIGNSFSQDATAYLHQMAESMNIDISPCFIEKLTNVKAQHKTPNGAIAVEWTRNNDKIILNLSSNGKLYGKITLPSGYVFEDGTTEKTYDSLCNIEIVV